MAALALPTVQANPQDSTPSWEDLRKQFESIEKKIGAAAKQPIISAGMVKSSKIGKDVDQSKLFNLHESFVTFMQKNIQDFINKTIKTVVSLGKPLMKEDTDKPSVEEQREARLIQEDYQTQQIEELKNITQLLEKILKTGGMGGKGGGGEGGWLDTIADFAQIANFLKGGKLHRLAKIAKAGNLAKVANAANKGRAITTAARVSDKVVKTTKAATTATKNMATTAMSKGKSIVGLGAKAGTVAAGTAAAAGVVPEIAGAVKGVDAASDVVTGAAKGADVAADITTGVAKGADTAADVAKGASAVSGAAKGADAAADAAKLTNAGIKGGARGLSKFLGPLSLLLDAGFGGYAIYKFMDLLDQREAGEVDDQQFEEQGKSLWVEIVRSLGYPAVGAIIGSFFGPGPGTLAGGVIGSTVGALDWGTEWLTGWSPAKALGEYIFEKGYMGDSSKEKEMAEETEKNNEALKEKARKKGAATASGTTAPAPTPSATPSPASTPTPTEAPTPSATPSPASTPTPTEAPTPSATSTPAPSATSTPAPSPTSTPTPSTTPTANIKTTPEGGETTKTPASSIPSNIASGQQLEEQTMKSLMKLVLLANGGSMQPTQIVNNYYNTTNVAGSGGSESIEDSSPVGQPSESIMNMMLSADAHGARMGINS